jgi:hypothetical protein
MKENAQKQRKERTKNMSDAHVGKSAPPEKVEGFSSWKIISEEGSHPVDNVLRPEQDREPESSPPEDSPNEEDALPKTAFSELPPTASADEASDGPSPEQQEKAASSKEALFDPDTFPSHPAPSPPASMNMLEALESDAAESETSKALGPAKSLRAQESSANTSHWSPQRLQALLTRMRPNIAIPRNNPELKNDLLSEKETSDSDASPSEDAPASTLEDYLSQRNAAPFREPDSSKPTDSREKDPSAESPLEIPARDEEERQADHPARAEDPLLLRVQEAWPHLPEPLRQTLVALVEAAADEK